MAAGREAARQGVERLRVGELRDPDGILEQEPLVLHLREQPPHAWLNDPRSCSPVISPIRALGQGARDAHDRLVIEFRRRPGPELLLVD